jgi:Fur family ferric uptake transcriptional regulator
MTRKKEEFKEEKDVFQEHIKRRGLRRTGQRDMILEMFLKTEEHLSSEDLHRLVRKKDSEIGYTTVYRTLKLLTEAGLAREVMFGDGTTYYEHHYAHEHHDHLICTECGRVVEFFSAEIESLQDAVAEGLGFRPTHHSLRMWGICAPCQKRASGTAVPSGAEPKVRVRPKGRRGK